MLKSTGSRLVKLVALPLNSMQNTGRVQTKQPILSRRLQTGVTLWPKIGNAIMQVSALRIDPLACAGETRQSVRVFIFFSFKGTSVL